MKTKTKTSFKSARSQAHKAKPTKPSPQNQAHKAKPTKPSPQSQAHKAKPTKPSPQNQAHKANKLMAYRLMFARAPLDLLTPEGVKAARQARFTHCVENTIALAFPQEG